ncbi:acetyl xylan esterase [Ascobolus immersus RN42]|uniref:Carboxylic ester hydrolase n=1 Tax=Ascobolus immersus RN42 TaxID=1160509 RepID=A0A3N4IKG1_ASCIM|nr:acetyl xylan esterase [Ascobolus immersus RN42]
MKFLNALLAFALTAPIATTFGQTNTLQRVQNYGYNPANVDMYYYIPECIQGATQGRPLMVALHYCHATAFELYAGAHDGPSFKQLADKYGFVVVYPSVNNDPDGCWDVHSTQSLTRLGGGESHSIISQVEYAHSTWGTAYNKVFTAGISGGAMMANVLAAVYPDRFAGAAVYGGVAHGCFAGEPYWNDDCAKGRVVKTAQQWGDLVRNAYGGYNGARPKVQVWHNTPDDVLDYVNMEEQVKQWTNVFGYPITPASTSYGSPTSAWTRRTYGPNFQALTSTIYSHVFPIMTQDTMEYFGLTRNVPTACQNQPTPTNEPAPTSTETGIVEEWKQCGGNDYEGPTRCVEGTTCQKVDDFYWQCKKPF